MTGQVLEGRAKPRGKYPHLKRAGDFVFVSGTSSRRPDNSIAGAEVDAMGTTKLDIKEQTAAVMENIREILGSIGAGLEDHRHESILLAGLLVDGEKALLLEHPGHAAGFP